MNWNASANPGYVQPVKRCKNEFSGVKYKVPAKFTAPVDGKLENWVCIIYYTFDKVRPGLSVKGIVNRLLYNKWWQ